MPQKTERGERGCRLIWPLSNFRYDLANSNVNDPHLETLPESSRPDVVIVKKIFGDKSLRNRKRKWRLKHMEGLHGAQETASQNNDYNDFLEASREDFHTVSFPISN